MPSIRPRRVNRVLQAADGTRYASMQVLVQDQDTNQPLRVYGDAAGTNLLSAMGKAATSATAMLDVYVSMPGQAIKASVLGADGKVVDVFYDLQAGDPSDQSELVNSKLYMSAGRITTAQAAVGANTDIILNSGSGTLGINTTTGVITLRGGRQYVLKASLAASAFSNTTGGSLTVEWVGGDNVPLLASRAAVLLPVSNTSAANNNPTTEILFTATSDAPVKLRCTAATGTAQIDVGNSSVLVYALD